MNCIKCDAHREDMQTGDHYCRELDALITPGTVKCPRQQEEKRWPVGGVNRTGKTDKISLENAVETPFWMAIWATEPERMIEVEMSYSDLKILCDLIDEKRKDRWIPVEERMPDENQEVWITTKYGAVMRAMYIAKKLILSVGIKDINQVSAWQPYYVPDPYNPEKDN